MATRIGFEPTIFGLTGQYVNRYTTGPLERCGIRHTRIWTLPPSSGQLSL